MPSWDVRIVNVTDHPRKTTKVISFREARELQKIVEANIDKRSDSALMQAFKEFTRRMLRESNDEDLASCNGLRLRGFTMTRRIASRSLPTPSCDETPEVNGKSVIGNSLPKRLRTPC